MKITAFVLLALAALLVAACAAVVRTGGHADSPDKSEVATVAVRAASDYDFRNKKDIYISISRARQEPPLYLFRKKYEYTMGATDWEIVWENQDTVRIVLYDYPDGQSEYTDGGAATRAARRREVDVLTYRRGTAPMEFVESPLGGRPVK